MPAANFINPRRRRADGPPPEGPGPASRVSPPRRSRTRYKSFTVVFRGHPSSPPSRARPFEVSNPFLPLSLVKTTALMKKSKNRRSVIAVVVIDRLATLFRDARDRCRFIFFRRLEISIAARFRERSPTDDVRERVSLYYSSSSRMLTKRRVPL